MEVLPALHRSSHAVGVWIEKCLREERISQPEAAILSFLLKHPRATINDAHLAFGHRRSTLTNVLDRLERREWLRRDRLEASRRFVVLTLSPQGREVAADVAELFEWVEAQAADLVSEDDLRGFFRVTNAIERLTHDR